MKQNFLWVSFIKFLVITIDLYSGKHFAQLFTHIPYFLEWKIFDISAKTWGHKNLSFPPKLTLVRVYFKFIDVRIIAIRGLLVFKDKFYFWNDMIVQTLPLQYNDFLRETWTQIKRLEGMMIVARISKQRGSSDKSSWKEMRDIRFKNF